MTLAWTELEADFTLRDYLTRRHYDADAIEDLLKLDVLILPGLPGEPHVAPPEGAVTENFVGSASDVRKVLERDGVSATLVADPLMAKREIVRKAAEIFLPAIVLVQQGAISLTMSLLANWIFQRFGRPSGAEEDGDDVAVEIIELEAAGATLRRIYCRGPANAVAKLLRREADGRRTKE